MATLDSEWLETFSAFASTLNLTHAARARHLSQPAVHMQLRRLSDAVGAPVYRRNGRRLELTTAGEQVAGYAADLRDRTADLLARLRPDGASGNVVLAAGEGAFLYLLGPAVQSFASKSKAALTLLTRDRDGTIAAVKTGTAQLGVTATEVEPEGVRSEVLASVPLSLIVPSRHRLATARRVRLSDLNGERFIVPAVDRPHRALIAQALRSAGIDWSVSVEANGWELMLHFAALGLGLAVVNGCCRIPRRLVARPLDELPRTSYQLIARHVPLAAPAAQLRERLLATMEQWRAAKRKG